MVHKHVHHKVGLAVLTTALLASWFGAGLPALKATVASPEAYHYALGLYDYQDSDHDGILDKYDGSPLGR